MVFKKADLAASLGLPPDEAVSLHRAQPKLATRLLIMVALFMTVNYLDRTNLALASVELTSALGLTAQNYGLGAALFFVSYCVLQIPSQMVMAYVGRQNLYIAGLLVAWGAVAAAMAGVRSIPQFLALRVLLGAFEAGALPALWTYLSHFYCKELLAVPLGVMMGTLVLSQALGPLLAAGLLAMGGLGGLAGWQWLFLIEGCLAILVAAGWLVMPRDVDEIKALTPDELAAVRASFAASHKPARGGNQLRVLGAALRNPVVYFVSSIKFTRDVAFYGVVYWCPMVVKSLMGINAFGAPAHEGGAEGSAAAKKAIDVVLLTAVPFAAAAAWQFLNAWHSQRTNERRFHLAGTWAFGAVCLLVLPLALRSFSAGFAVLVLAAMGTLGAEGIMIAHFMALQGGEKGLGMAFINSAGGVGGFVGPMVIGALKGSTGNYNAAMLVLGAFLATASLLTAVFDPKWAERWMMRSRERRAAAARDVEGGAGAAAATDAKLGALEIEAARSRNVIAVTAAA